MGFAHELLGDGWLNEDSSATWYLAYFLMGASNFADRGS